MKLSSVTYRPQMLSDDSLGDHGLRERRGHRESTCTGLFTRDEIQGCPFLTKHNNGALDFSSQAPHLLSLSRQLALQFAPFVDTRKLGVVFSSALYIWHSVSCSPVMSAAQLSSQHPFPSSPLHTVLVATGCCPDNWSSRFQLFPGCVSAFSNLHLTQEPK